MTIDKKLKNKLILYAVLFFIGLITALFLSAFLFQMVSRQETAAGQYYPHVIIASIMNNKLHAMMFLSAAMLLLMIIILLMNYGSGDNFASELDQITDTIKTPKKIGQSQHGSARWLTKKEQEKIFTSYVIDRHNNPVIKALMQKGAEEIKAVKKYEDTIINAVSTENTISEKEGNN